MKPKSIKKLLMAAMAKGPNTFTYEGEAYNCFDRMRITGQYKTVDGKKILTGFLLERLMGKDVVGETIMRADPDFSRGDSLDICGIYGATKVSIDYK